MSAFGTCSLTHNYAPDYQKRFSQLKAKVYTKKIAIEPTVAQVGQDYMITRKWLQVAKMLESPPDQRRA